MMNSTDVITSAQMILLRTALEQLQQKKVKLEEVRIADSIQDAMALEEEICEIEEYRTVLMLSFKGGGGSINPLGSGLPLP